MLRVARATLLGRTAGPTRRWLSVNRDTTTSLISHLKERGLVANVTSENLEQVLQKGTKISLYCGADPTAKSLHLGNLIPLLVLLHFYIRGHTAVSLVGGATGEVGDPSGRLTERGAMEDAVRKDNIQRIQAQMKLFMERGAEYAKTKGYSDFGSTVRVNNADWWRDMPMLHFLGTYGRHIRVSQMLARESVKQRLSSEQGIGFNEFTYQILQAFDFWHLYKTQNCSVQVGGNDQWGNITAGIDLISRLKGSMSPPLTEEAFGLTVPLLTTPSGEKFGKSAGNAVWIDAALTRPYDLYQYFIQVPDSELTLYLKMFTLLPIEEVPAIIETHEQDPGLRYGQRVLAREITDLVHGLGAGSRSELISKILFPLPNAPAIQHSAKEILDAFDAEDLVLNTPRAELVGAPWRSVLAKALNKSSSECSRMLKAGGVYYGYSRTPVKDQHILSENLEDGQLLLVRTGKSKYTVIRAV